MTTRLSYGCDFFSSQSITQEQFREELARSQIEEPQPHSILDGMQSENQLQHAIDSFLRVDCLRSEELKKFTKCVVRL